MAKCEERSGFLFAHDCHEPVVESCATCNKAICQVHSHPQSGGLVCSTCAKGAARQKPSSQAAKSSRRDRTTRDRHYHDSPFLYGSAYYGYGYGHYGHGYWGSRHMNRDDFTEADGESLSGGAGEGFEDDVGGS